MINAGLVDVDCRGKMWQLVLLVQVPKMHVQVVLFTSSQKNFHVLFSKHKPTRVDPELT